MRLRVAIQRHGLPATSILWTSESSFPQHSASHRSATISQLVDDINSIVPLESGEWGLEDYVVEVEGYECLHFQPIDILHENDQVMIRPLLTSDLRQRRITGRHQVSSDGRHLIDGVPYGRPYLRKTDRPEIPPIPSRKRKRNDLEQDLLIGEGRSDFGAVLPQYLGPYLIAAAGEDTALSEEGDEGDEDFTGHSSMDEEDESSSTDLEKELHDIQADLDDDESEVDISEEYTRPVKRRKTRASSISGASPDLTRPLLEHHHQSSIASSQREGVMIETKTSRNVSFEDQADRSAQHLPKDAANNASSGDESSDSEGSRNEPTAREPSKKKPLVAANSETSDSEESSDESVAVKAPKTTIQMAKSSETSDSESSDNSSADEPRRNTFPALESSSEDSSDSETSESDIGPLRPLVQSSPDEDVDSDSGSSSIAHQASDHDSSSEESSSNSQSDSDNTPPGISGLGQRPNSESSSEDSSSEDESNDASASRNFGKPHVWHRGASYERQVNYERAFSPSSDTFTSSSDMSDSDTDSSSGSRTARPMNVRRYPHATRGKEPIMSASESSESSSDESSSESGDESDSAHSVRSQSSESSSGTSRSSISSPPTIEPSKTKPHQQLPHTSSMLVPPIRSAPGQGLKKTKNNNKRQQKRRQLAKLKEQGILPKEANFEDLRQVDKSDLPQSVADDAAIRNEKENLETRKNDLLGLLEGQNDQVTRSQPELETLEQIPASELKMVDRARKTGEFVERRVFAMKDDQTGAVQPAISENTTPAKPVSKPDSVSEPVQKRARLDIESSRRLVFGSLGVRTPRSKSAERQLREKFASEGRRRPIMRAPDVKTITEPSLGAETHEPPQSSKSESSNPDWQKKLIVSAVECQRDGITMSAPPFPFVQGWDEEVIERIRVQKGQQQDSAKKQNRDRQEINEDQNSEMANPGEAPIEQSSPTEFNGAIRDQLMRENHDLSALSPEDFSSTKDLPCLPKDVIELPDLTLSKAIPGAIIAYQILQMGPKFEPFVSDYLTARVERISEDGTLEVKIATRDQKAISMPNLTRLEEFENEEGDPALVEVRFDNMYGPRLVQEAPSIQSSGGPCLDCHEYNQDERGEETSRTLSHGDSQMFEGEASNVDNRLHGALPTITTPRRQEISAMMTEAGFESGINSELRPQTNLSVPAPEKGSTQKPGCELAQSNGSEGENHDLPDRATFSKISPVEQEEHFESISEPVFAGFDSSPRPVGYPREGNPAPRKEPEVTVAIGDVREEDMFTDRSVHYPSLPPESVSKASHFSPAAPAVATDEHHSPSYYTDHDSEITPRRLSQPDLEEPHAESLKSYVQETEPSPTNSRVTNPFHISYSQSDGAAFSEDDDFSDLPSIGKLVSSARSPDVSPPSLKIAHRKRDQSPDTKSPTSVLPSSSGQATPGYTRADSKYEQPIVKKTTFTAVIDSTSADGNEKIRNSQGLNSASLAASQVPEGSQVVDLTLDTSSSPIGSQCPGDASDDDSEYMSSQNIKAEVSSQQSQRKLSLRRRTRGSNIVRGWREGRRVDGSQRSSW